MEATAEDTPKDSAENVLPENNIAEKPTAAVPETSRRPKRDDRNKKDEKTVEQFIKSLNSIPTMEEKLLVVSKKYVQASEDNKKMQFYIKQSDKRYALLLKEKEQLQLEFNKTILLKSKLENLCRELQKQNKAIKEESLLKIREEEERCKETQSKFQNTLTEFTTLLQQNNEKNAKLRDDNINMTEKFKSVVTQYQLREQQVDKMAKQMALESQLADAKLQKASLEHQADRERLMAEMEQMKVNLAQYRAKIAELQGTETSLRSQLAVYTDKYDEFQNALVKSNQVFGGFKEQMEKMSKKIKKLEKESLTWKQRWETSKTALIDMCAEKQAGEERSARQLHHMQGLCRTLQAERAVLLSSLKEHGIERPPLPAAPPAPAELPAAPAATAEPSGEKVEALKHRLSQIQDQLKILRETPPPAQEEPPKAEKSKKSKSKKNKEKKSQGSQKKDAVKPEDSAETELQLDDETDGKLADVGGDPVAAPHCPGRADSPVNNNSCDLEAAKSDDSLNVSPLHEANSPLPELSLSDLKIAASPPGEAPAAPGAATNGLPDAQPASPAGDQRSGEEVTTI